MQTDVHQSMQGALVMHWHPKISFWPACVCQLLLDVVYQFRPASSSFVFTLACFSIQIRLEEPWRGVLAMLKDPCSASCLLAHFLLLHITVHLSVCFLWLACLEGHLR